MQLLYPCSKVQRINKTWHLASRKPLRGDAESKSFTSQSSVLPCAPYPCFLSDLPRRALIADESQRVNARNEALEGALHNVNRGGYDARFCACITVEHAHLLSAETGEAIAREKTTQFADALRQVASTIKLGPHT